MMKQNKMNNICVPNNRNRNSPQTEGKIGNDRNYSLYNIYKNKKKLQGTEETKMKQYNCAYI